MIDDIRTCHKRWSSLQKSGEVLLAIAADEGRCESATEAMAVKADQRSNASRDPEQQGPARLANNAGSHGRKHR